jgi:hypothetical protein
MTRASKSPVRRIVEFDDRFGTRLFVVELQARHMTIRPLGARSKGPQAMEVTYGPLYQRLVEAKVEGDRRARRRGKRRTA